MYTLSKNSLKLQTRTKNVRRDSTIYIHREHTHCVTSYYMIISVVNRCVMGFL